MTLWQLPVKRSGTIVRLGDQLAKGDAERLADLGFEAGECIACLQRTPLGGPATYRIGDSVFSLAREIAHHIEIKETP